MSIKINNVEVSDEELIKVVKDHPELKAKILEEKKSFEERMVGEIYWRINENNGKNRYINNNPKILKEHLASNNVFFSELACDKEIARRKALGRIMKFIRDNEIELVKDEDWGNLTIKKWEISGWNYGTNRVELDDWRNNDYSQHNLAFYTQEDRTKVLAGCEKDLEILLKK